MNRAICTFYLNIPEHLDNKFFGNSHRNCSILGGFLETWVQSLSITNPNEILRIEGINMPLSLIEKIKRINNSLIINNKEIDFKNITQNDFLITRNILVPKFQLDMVQKYNKVIVMDFDCFIRSSLHPIFEILDDADMALRINKMDSKAGSMECGVLGYKGIKASSFLKEWVHINENILANSKGDNWIGNQEHLYNLIIKYDKENRFALKTIPPIYETKNLSNQDSVIYRKTVIK